MEEKLETFKGNSEVIDLEYLVEFKDGLKPTIFVFGIDSQTGNFYGASVYLGLEIGTGFRFVEREDRSVTLERVISVRNSILIQELKEISKGEYKDNYENFVIEKGREIGTNVIKVGSREHVMPAISRHADLYGEQFKSLGYQSAELFDTFLQEHTGYLSGIKEISEAQQETEEHKL